MAIHLKHGKRAEHNALRFLKQQGLHLILENYRCRSGEIDLIMQDHQVIVFVEVRLRTNPTYGSAVESISTGKQCRIIHAAQHYLITQGKVYQHHDARFDVLGINAQQQIDWIKNAFEVQ
ncbi:MAG: YraN family protein [Coxiella sp. RIFCSPHIGHO2_12_FULL_42_15]|nr:MAG: YraN family protein [Coxiella sp. RIFCSPHIGHO2_12_FULL_42_15]